MINSRASSSGRVEEVDCAVTVKDRYIAPRRGAIGEYDRSSAHGGINGRNDVLSGPRVVDDAHAARAPDCRKRK